MKSLSHRWRLRISLAFSAALIIAGVMIMLEHHQPPASLKAPANSNAAPSSAKPTSKQVQQYTVAPGLPRYISIPAIHVSQARVIQLGLTNNQIASPSNIYDAGWYNGSAKPGASGAMFIYGHVSSWTADGIFYNLKKLVPRDTISIERGDGQTYTYAVKASKIYPADSVDMNAVLNPVDANTPGLNLMTCTGTVIKGTSNFNERLVVFTSLIQ